MVGTIVRVTVTKRPNAATESEQVDRFRVGDILDLSARVAFLMTAAGWVRRIFEREWVRRRDFSRAHLFPDRRLLSDRRATGVA